MSSKCGHLQCITDMPCMTPGESLKGISYAKQVCYTCSAGQPCLSITEALCLSVTSTGKVGHGDATQKLTGNGKDLHILIFISMGVETTRR